MCGTFSEGVWNFSPLSPSADLLPPLRVTPPRGLSRLSALKQNEHKARFFALSVLWHAAFFLAHRRDTRSGLKSKCQPVPRWFVQNSHFQKRAALAVLTDNRLSCRCCISEAGAQFNLVRSNKRAWWTQLKVFFCLFFWWGWNVFHKPNYLKKKKKLKKRQVLCWDLAPPPHFIPDMWDPGSQLPLMVQKYYFFYLFLDSVPLIQLIFTLGLLCAVVPAQNFRTERDLDWGFQGPKLSSKLHVRRFLWGTRSHVAPATT